MVADHDLEIRRLIHFMLESNYQATVIEAVSLRESNEKLKRDGPFDCVVSGFDPKEAGMSELSKLASALSPKPAMLFCNFEKEPEALAILQEKIRPIYQELQKLNPEPVPQFCKIPMDLILKLGLLHCDLYIKINDSKYVKNFRKGDIFDSFDFTRYAAKNIEFLYLQPNDAKRALIDLARNLQKVSDVESITTDEGIQLSSTSLELISSFNQTLGFTEETKKLTQVSVELALKTIRESPKLADLYSIFLYNPRNYLASHSTSLAYLSCGLASLLGWGSEQTFYKLTLAAFLHDLPLKTDALSRIPNEEELLVRGADFTDEERALFLNHPQEAAGLLKAMKDLPPEVATILVQHHERPDGKGFPLKLKNTQIHPLSAVFIVAEHLISFRTMISTDVHLSHFINSLDESYFQEPFLRIIESITESLVE